MNLDYKRFSTAFGKAIKNARNERGLSQERLGDLAGLHRTYIGDIERAERNVTLVSATKIASALNLKLSVLINSAENFISDDLPKGRT